MTRTFFWSPHPLANANVFKQIWLDFFSFLQFFQLVVDRNRFTILEQRAEEHAVKPSSMTALIMRSKPTSSQTETYSLFMHWCFLLWRYPFKLPLYLLLLFSVTVYHEAGKPSFFPLCIVSGSMPLYISTSQYIRHLSAALVSRYSSFFSPLTLSVQTWFLHYLNALRGH